MPSSETLKTGDRVAVPWGVDTREGEVVAAYRTGAVERVVVRLTVPEGSGEEPPTVEVPADSVVPLSENPDLPPPGSWLPGFRYERDVAEALVRVLADSEPTVRLNAQRSGKEIDILVESQRGVIVAEVKTVDHLSEGLFDAVVWQLREAMKTYPDAKGLLVTHGTLPPSVEGRVRTGGLLSRDVGVVRWRGPRDNKRFDHVVHALLNNDSGRLKVNEA
jgi:hypothetical protein